MSEVVMSDQTQHPPVVTVVAGSPTPEELAAIITVVTAAAAGDGPAEERRSDRPRVGGWRSYTRTLRGAAYPGPGAWRDIDH